MFSHHNRFLCCGNEIFIRVGKGMVELPLIIPVLIRLSRRIQRHLKFPRTLVRLKTMDKLMEYGDPFRNGFKRTFGNYRRPYSSPRGFGNPSAPRVLPKIYHHGRRQSNRQNEFARSAFFGCFSRSIPAILFESLV
jgi:hypothetical protein